MAERRYPPNRLLAWERLQRGWSYEELAERIKSAMVTVGETDTGLCANTVRRWETGERWPDPRYRKHLVVIFGMRATELGLLTPEELRLCPDTKAVNEVRRLCEVMIGGMSDGRIGRAEIMRGILAAGALPFLAPLLQLDTATLNSVSRSERPVSDPGNYGMIAGCHRKLYWTSPPRPLFEAAYAHTRLGVMLLRGVSGSARVTLAGHVADSALLAARLAFFDLDQAAIAECCFELAWMATREAGDHTRAVVVIGHSAFLPIFSNRPDRAKQLLDAARQHAWHGVGSQVRSWLHCVASEAEARASNGDASQRHVDLAQEALDPDSPMSEWLDFYDADRWHSFAGYAALIRGDPESASCHLTRSLHGLASNSVKQRSVILADLASTCPGDADLAARYLHEAIDALEQEWYATGLQRVREVRPHLGDGLLGTEIDERLNPLALN